MQKSVLSITGIIVLGIIVLLVNALSHAVLGRFNIDLTEERLYTLSDGTKNILGSLELPIKLRAYVSRTDATKFPALKIYGDRVQSLLKEYERAGKGKVSLEVFDPRPDSDEETWAQKYGIQPLNMPTGESVYFGMAAVNARGEEEVIPVFSLQRQEFLEYDITRAIYSLSQEEKPVIGILTPLKMEGQAAQSQMYGQRTPGGEPWVVVNQLQQFAQVRFLKPEEGKIDPAIKSLFVIHPKGLTPATLYAIDQFVLNGGNLFVAIDPYANVDQPDPAAGQDPSAAMAQDKSSNLKELLGAWGVELVEKKVAGDINLSTKVATSREQPPQDFVLWLTVDAMVDGGKSLINREDMLTSQLNNVLFPWPGVLRKKDVPGVTFEPLLETTKDAALFDENDYRFNGGQPDMLLNRYLKGTEQLVLAARLDGKFKSNFTAPPEGAPPAGTTNPHLAESKDASHVVVVADVDFLSDQASTVSQSFLGQRMVTAINDNLALAGNIADNLLGSNDLISLRSRGQFMRPFTRVREIEKRAEERWRMEEMSLQATLNGANQRLSQLQAGTDKQGKEQVLTQALLEEVKKIREQRSQAQQRLREVRRNLRQDKERLGEWLFVLNTFAVPLLLIGTVTVMWLRSGKKKKTS